MIKQTYKKMDCCLHRDELIAVGCLYFHSSLCQRRFYRPAAEQCSTRQQRIRSS